MTSSKIGGFGISLFNLARSREQVLIHQTVTNYFILSERLRILKGIVRATVVLWRFLVLFANYLGR